MKLKHLRCIESILYSWNLYRYGNLLSWSKKKKCNNWSFKREKNCKTSENLTYIHVLERYWKHTHLQWRKYIEIQRLIKNVLTQEHFQCEEVELTGSGASACCDPRKGVYRFSALFFMCFLGFGKFLTVYEAKMVVSSFSRM